MFKSDSPFIVLYTTDVKMTHDFYYKIGAEITQLEEDKVVVSFAGYDFHFILNTSEPFKSYKYIAEQGKYGQGIIYYIESDDLDKDQDAVKQAGGKIVAPVFENMWGARECLFEDPSGFKFALWQVNNT